jgi:hypothetical protein
LISGITHIQKSIQLLIKSLKAKAGYVVVASFIIAVVCWTDNFFKPAVSAQKAFLEKYKGNKSVKNL